MVLDETMLPCAGDPDWSVGLRLDEAECYLNRMRHDHPGLLVEHRGAEEANTQLYPLDRPRLTNIHMGMA